MSGKIRLYGENSGYSELNAPDDAGDQSFTLPESGGDIVATNGTPQNGQAPVWNSSTNQWEPGSVASGGGGGIEEAPLDGQQYARKNAGWSVVESSGGGGGDGVSTKADIYGTAKVRGIVAGGFGTNLSGCTASSGTSAVGVNRITFNTPQTDTNYEVVLGGTAASSNVVCQLVAKTTTYFEVGIFRLTSPNVYSDDPIDFAVFDNTPAEIIVGSGTVTNTNIYGTAKAWGTVALGVGSGLVGCTTSPLVNGSSQVTFNTPMLTDDYQVVIAPIATVAGVSGYVTGKDVNGFVVANISNVNGNFTSDPIDFAVFDNEPAEVALTTFGDVINYSGPAAWGSVSAQGVLVNGMNIASTELVSVASYSVVFSTPMPDANYSVVIGCEDNTNGRQATLYETTKVGTFTKTANGFSYYTQDLAAPSNVPAAVNFAVFATNALPPKGGTGTDSWATVKAVSSNGPCTVPASFNTASVTRTAVGKYEVVFDTPMPSANYAVQVTCIDGGAKQASVDNLTPTGFTAQIFSSGGAATDKDFTFTVNATNAQLPNTVTQEQIESAINNPGLSAWGASDGDGNLLSGLNVSSITRTSGGNYTVNFQTPMPSVNYSAVASSEIAECKVKNLSTTSFDITTSGSSGNAGDSDFQFQVAATNALAPQYGVGADAWGRVSTTSSLLGGFNIASVERVSGEAAGAFLVTFTTPMPTEEYSAVITPVNSQYFGGVSSQTKDSFKVYLRNAANNDNLGNSEFSFTVHASSTVTPTYTWTRNGTTLEPANAGDTVVADCNTDGSSGTSGAGQIVGYQQGIWTPTVNVGTVAATNARWFRIGNAVTVFATLSSFSNNTSSDTLRFLNVPYANDAATVMGSAMYRYVSLEGCTSTFISGDAIFLYGGKNGDWVALEYSQLNSSGATEMYVSGTYTTDDTTWTPINGATIS